jgi:hypothetical protein
MSQAYPTNVFNQTDSPFYLFLKDPLLSCYLQSKTFHKDLKQFVGLVSPLYTLLGFVDTRLEKKKMLEGITDGTDHDAHCPPFIHYSTV